MDFAILGHDEQQTAAGLKGAAQFAENGIALADMFQRHDVQAGIEAGGGKGQAGEIAEDIEALVVPLRITDGEVRAGVAAVRKVLAVLAFSGAGVENAGTWGKGSAEGGGVIADGGFKEPQVALQERWNAPAPAIGTHGFFRASTMMVAPWRQAASSMAKGQEAMTRPK